MLTMGRPIQLKCARNVGISGELFGEKIRANYEQMQGRIDPVEILHFLSAPPEYYAAKTGMTIMVNQQNGEKRQNLEISLVNNMLNRILVSERMAFTYQDRVFVENILKKLGVADVRKFIGQVQKIKEVTGMVKKFSAVCGSRRDTIRLTKEYRMAAALLKRLRIADSYREAGRYTAYCLGSRKMLDRLELSFGEQRVAASYLALNEYRNGISARKQHTDFDLNGQYKPRHNVRTDKDSGQTAAYFLQDALLHAIGQIFHIRYTEFTEHTGFWHEFMDALHVSVRNTFQRVERQARTTVFEGQPQDTWPREAATLSLERLEREEEIRRQLTHIDIQNKERVERLMEYAERERQSAEETVKETESLRKIREEGTESLRKIREEGTESLRKIREEGTESLREIREEETESLRGILGEETMRVFETIRGYQEDPGRHPNVTASGRQAMNLLMRDIAAAGETHKSAAKVLSGRSLQQPEDPVELFHRQNGQTVNEERLQEFLRTQRKDMRIQNTNVQKAFHEKTQVEEIVRSKVNEMKGRQEEEIVRLINQNVRRQLDTLSEKVYGKLEKRMDAERRRRGI